MENKPYNQINCILNTVCVFSTILSFGLFLTFLLLLTTNQQFITFNEFSATGKYPAIYFYEAIVLVVLYFAMIIVCVFGIKATNDIFNKWSQEKMTTILVLNSALFITGILQLAAGILAIVYAKTMPVPLREYMAENLRSNYTGGLNVGFLERRYDRYVDWMQINYQCCGVISYEDYRNGYFYNSYNKYTIVSIVPPSCCIYRDQTSQLAQCQMKSVNIYRKGCYDILMFWMESFGSIVASLTIVTGSLFIIFSAISTNITIQVRTWKERQTAEKNLLKHKIFSSHINNNYHVGQNIQNKQDLFDTTTLDETLSYIETKT